MIGGLIKICRFFSRFFAVSKDIANDIKNSQNGVSETQILSKFSFVYETDTDLYDEL